jgi:hypothetical protein
MSVEALGRIVQAAEVINAWVGAVHAYALQRAIDGDDIPGCKLVEKRAMRRWVDEDAAAEALEAGGVDPHDKKLVTVAEAERRAKKAGTKVPDVLWEKKSSGFRLAVEFDRRPRLDSGSIAEQEFGRLGESNG